MGRPPSAGALTDPLALTVGCTFGLETPIPVSAVLQVAPSERPRQMRGERWVTSAPHHGYLDLYGNRCERFTLPAGASRIVYEAEVVLDAPGDRISPGTPETPVMALPDEHLAFVMPSRFCLPDELGGEAWERTRSTLATTAGASAGSSWGAAVTPSTSRSSRRSGP